MSVAWTVVSSIFWGLLVLSLLVFVHEGGHFLAARACGMRVTEFFLGMPCRVRWARQSRTRGTTFGVTPILLGGYTRICGMEGMADDLLAPCLALVQERGTVSAAQVAEALSVGEDRAIDLLASLADLAAIEPLYDPDKGEHPGQSAWPERFRTLQRDGHGRTVYDRGHDFSEEGTTAAGEPRPIEGDPQAFLEGERAQTYAGKGFWKRLVTLVAGPAVNVVLALTVIAAGVGIGGVQYVVNSNVLAQVEQGSAAEAAGLQAGDAITSINGADTPDWQSVVSALDGVVSRGGSFALTFERDGQSHDVTVDLPAGATSFGVVAQVDTYRPGVGESLAYAVDYARLVATYAVRLIMPQHTMETLQGTSSVVGISAMAGQAAAAGPLELVLFVGMISMSLGFMNLLPIPPLDGGKVLIEVIQALARRQLSLRVQTAISYAGLAFFLVIFAYALRNDIVNFMMG